MNQATLPEELLASLRPGEVRFYLESRGWSSAPYGSEGKGLVFHRPDFPGVDLLVPLKRELGDYAARMGDVVNALATIEERPVWEIVNELCAPSGDMLRLRVAADDATLGNLPLEEGIQLLRGGRDLLTAAAWSALHPQALHSQRIPKEVKKFLRDCRLGQTERGSFIATIITPVPPLIQGSIVFEDEVSTSVLEPYPRRVTTGLMSTLALVSNAIESGEPGRILGAIDKGVSANLCEALEMMKPAGDGSRLDISVSWARTRRHVSEDIPRDVTFPQESFAFIQEAGQQLRKWAFAGSKKYRGKLLTVQRIKRPFIPDLAGRIVLATDVGGEPAKLRVDLGEEHFRQACDALRDGKDIALSGIIRHDVKTREYELYEPRGFEVINDS